MLLLLFLVGFTHQVLSAPASAPHQSVTFPKRPTDKAAAPKARPSRSYFHHDVLTAALVDQDLFLHALEQYEQPAPSFEINRGHLTPDFTDGLQYPDPFLLTGYNAKRVVEYLYSKPLFFGQIRHINALHYNQDVRRQNGLAGNILGSLRHYQPFNDLYRFKKAGFNSGFNQQF